METEPNSFFEDEQKIIYRSQAYASQPKPAGKPPIKPKPASEPPMNSVPAGIPPLQPPSATLLIKKVDKPKSKEK